MAVGATKVVQVTNIAPQATKDQMHVLFGYLGKIDDIRLYPTVRDVSIPVQSRICYIKFTDSLTSGIAQHMTNTVFIDRALIVIPVQSGEIPDEYYALEMTKNGTIVPGFNVNEPKLPPHVVNSVQGSGADRVILTIDSTLDQHNLPNYPPLPASFDSVKVEETRRTILIRNVDQSITMDEWIKHLTSAGEVKYLRACVCTKDHSNNLLLEFTDQSSIINALRMDGSLFKGKPLEIQHATQPIDKPQAKSNEAAQREIEEAMTRFKEAQNQINATIEPVIGMLTKDKKGSRRSRSRSRSRERRRRRSRSTSRRRSRSRRRRSTSRKRSRSRDRRRRSRSRRRTRSRSRKRSVSKPRRSRSKSRRRSRSKDRKIDKDRKSRDRSKERKRSPRDKSKDRKSRASSKAKDKSVDKDVDRKRSRSKSRSKSRKRSRSRDRRRVRRSRSRGSRRRTPTPPRRRRSRSKSRDRDRDSKRKDKKERKRSRTRSRDRKASSRAKSRGKSRSKSRSRSKVSRSRDESKREVEQKPLEVAEENREAAEKEDNMDISNSP